MAGFFAHLGGITFPGTASSSLPMINATGVLDSIVSDIGGGVNGWSVWDDQRVSGSTNFMWGKLWYNGIFQENAVSNGWSFVSASTQTLGSTTANGFHYHYAISGISGVFTPISVDQTNVYNAYATQLVTNSSATLDRPYAGATLTFTNTVYEKLTSYVVLKHTGGQKDFYVWLSMNGAKSPSPYILRARTYETWDNSTHSGTNGGQEEMLRIYNIGTAPIDSKMMYTLCAYPNALILWVGGLANVVPATGTTLTASFANTRGFFYAGNLDTSGVRDNDTDALWAGFSDTSYSGIVISNAAYNTALALFGASQCLRTVNGQLWNQPSAYTTNTGLPYNCYYIKPRGVSYVEHIDKPSLNSQMKFEFTEIDVYQAGANISAWSAQGAPEGRRGKIRYLACPSSNPSGMAFSVVGPTDSGAYYVILTFERPFLGTGVTPSLLTADVHAISALATSFSWAIRTATAWGEYIVNNGTGFIIRTMMVQIL